MIKIICLGKLKETYLREAQAEYTKRISKYSKIEIVEIKDSDIFKESEEILKNINDKDYNIIMDIKGKMIDSVELSTLIDKTFTSGYNTITFIIGASNGVTDDVKNRCNYRLSFSNLTLMLFSPP